MDKIVYSTYSDRCYIFECVDSFNHTIKCINGRVTGSNKCVGYCQYEGHPGFLTKELRKQHNCIGKECYYYIQKRKTTAVT